MKKIAVFASGGGTDFQSVIDANARENFCVIEYLVASKPGIGAIDRAEKNGITPLIFDKEKEFTVKAEDQHTKCGWSPYEGETLKGVIETVLIDGESVL